MVLLSDGLIVGNIVVVAPTDVGNLVGKKVSRGVLNDAVGNLVNSN